MFCSNINRPTFVTIFKKKSSDGFQSIPYVVALSSAMLLLYYGVLKTDANMIISINAIGIAIEVTYLTIYLIYASRDAKVGRLYFSTGHLPIKFMTHRII